MLPSETQESKTCRKPSSVKAGNQFCSLTRRSSNPVSTEPTTNLAQSQNAIGDGTDQKKESLFNSLQEFRPKRPNTFLWLSGNESSNARGYSYKIGAQEDIEQEANVVNEDPSNVRLFSTAENLKGQSELSKSKNLMSRFVEKIHEKEINENVLPQNFASINFNVRQVELKFLNSLAKYLEKILLGQEIELSDCQFSEIEFKILKAFVLRKFSAKKRKL